MNASKALPRNFCLLVEDHPKYCAFLEKIVAQAFPALELKIARNYREAMEWLRSLNPASIRLSFALIDIGLPDGSGIDLIQDLHKVDPNIRAIVSTVFMDDSYIFEALSAGAYGYILKGECPEAFAKTLLRIERDEPPLSPQIARRLLTHFRTPKPLAAKDINLTPREKQTLTLIVQGLTVPEAAEAMGISAQTASGYVKVIYQKLHVSNRAEVTREAIRRGMV